MIRIPKKRQGPGDTHTRISDTSGVYLGCPNRHEWYCPGSVARQTCPECGKPWVRCSMISHKNQTTEDRPDGKQIEAEQARK